MRVIVKNSDWVFLHSITPKKARFLLKEKKAVIESKEPFTIRLLFSASECGLKDSFLQQNKSDLVSEKDKTMCDDRKETEELHNTYGDYIQPSLNVIMANPKNKRIKWCSKDSNSANGENSPESFVQTLYDACTMLYQQTDGNYFGNFVHTGKKGFEFLQKLDPKRFWEMDNWIGIDDAIKVHYITTMPENNFIVSINNKHFKDRDKFIVGSIVDEEGSEKSESEEASEQLKHSDNNKSEKENTMNIETITDPSLIKKTLQQLKDSIVVSVKDENNNVQTKKYTTEDYVDIIEQYRTRLQFKDSLYEPDAFSSLSINVTNSIISRYVAESYFKIENVKKCYDDNKGKECILSFYPSGFGENRIAINFYAIFKDYETVKLKSGDTDYTRLSLNFKIIGYSNKEFLTSHVGDYEVLYTKSPITEKSLEKTRSNKKSIIDQINEKEFLQLESATIACILNSPYKVNRTWYMKNDALVSDEDSSTSFISTIIGLCKLVYEQNHREYGNCVALGKLGFDILKDNSRFKYKNYDETNGCIGSIDGDIIVHYIPTMPENKFIVSINGEYDLENINFTIGEIMSEEVHVPKTHLIFGYYGCGKTTYIRQLINDKIQNSLGVCVLTNAYSAKMYFNKEDKNLHIFTIADILTFLSDNEKNPTNIAKAIVDCFIANVGRFNIDTIAVDGIDLVIYPINSDYSEDEYFRELSKCCKENKLNLLYTKGINKRENDSSYHKIPTIFERFSDIVTVIK